MKFTVVAVPTWDQVTVEWTEEFGLTNSMVHRYLAEQLAWVRGVNELQLKRYAVWLSIERRVAAPESVGKAVLQLLQDDPEFRYVVEHSLPPNTKIDLEFEYRRVLRTR